MDFEQRFYNEWRPYFEAGNYLIRKAEAKAAKFIVIGVALFVGLYLAGTVHPALQGLLLAVLITLGLIKGRSLMNDLFKGASPNRVGFPHIREAVYHQIVSSAYPWMRYRDIVPPMGELYRRSDLVPGQHEFIHVSGGVSGVFGQTPFMAAIVHSGYYERVKTKDGRGKNVESVKPKTLFKGVVLVTEFPRKFAGWVTVHGDGWEKFAGWLASELRSARDEAYVRMDNPDFEERFHVRASDPQTAHYVLSTSFMDQILELNQRHSSQPFALSFRDSTLMLAIPGEENPLEWKFGENGDYETAASVAGLAALIAELLMELNLDETIWDTERIGA